MLNVRSHEKARRVSRPQPVVGVASLGELGSEVKRRDIKGVLPLEDIADRWRSFDRKAAAGEKDAKWLSTVSHSDLIPGD